MNTKTTGGGTAAPGPCPDLETLASFVDGNLTAAERTRVVEHLADCARCAETVAEAMQILGEAGLEEETVEDDEAGETDRAPALIPPPPARVLPFRRWAAVALPLAAAAALAVALWPAGFGGKSWVGEEMARHALGGAATTTLGTSWGGLGIFRSAYRGPGETLALRAGVLSVDLAAAIAGGDEEAAAGFAEDMQSELREEVWGDPASAAEYGDLAERLRSGEPAASLAARASALELEARRQLGNEAGFIAGAWAEAGRLAATLGNQAYLTDPRTLSQAKELARSDLSPALAIRVSEIADLLAAGAHDLDDLRRRFDALIRAGSQ